MNKGKQFNNIIIYAISFIIFISIIIGYNKLFTENVKLHEEFLLLKCISLSHNNEKVYMKINNIEKNSEDDSMYILSFDLRYEGDKPIRVIEGEDNFSDLSKFKLTVKPKNIFKKLTFEYFELGDTSYFDSRIHSYRESLPDSLNPGDSLKDLKIGIDLYKHKDINISDLKFRIKSYPELKHNAGKSKFRKVKELYMKAVSYY